MTDWMVICCIACCIVTAGTLIYAYLVAKGFTRTVQEMQMRDNAHYEKMRKYYEGRIDYWYKVGQNEKREEEE